MLVALAVACLLLATVSEACIYPYSTSETLYFPRNHGKIRICSTFSGTSFFEKCKTDSSLFFLSFSHYTHSLTHSFTHYIIYTHSSIIITGRKSSSLPAEAASLLVPFIQQQIYHNDMHIYQDCYRLESLLLDFDLRQQQSSRRHDVARPHSSKHHSCPRNPKQR